MTRWIIWGERHRSGIFIHQSVVRRHYPPFLPHPRPQYLKIQNYHSSSISCSKKNFLKMKNQCGETLDVLSSLPLVDDAGSGTGATRQWCCVVRCSFDLTRPLGFHSVSVYSGIFVKALVYRWEVCDTTTVVVRCTICKCTYE